MRKRAGGTVTNAVIAAILIYPSASVAYFYISGLSSNHESGGFPNPSVSVTTATSGNSTSSTIPADNMSLAELQTLSFGNSSKCDGLLDSGYWSTAIQTSGNSTAHLVPNTVYSLTQSWNGWTEFFRDNMTNPPAWLSIGFGNYTSTLQAELAAQVMGTHNITLAAAVMRNYTSEIGALGAVGLDFLTWGGLSGVRVGYETGSFSQAAAQTFPGQVYQLFQLSQDCSYSEQQRAQYLGTALSMTAIVLATSGKDGFGPQFKDLLTKLGIGDAWPGIKGSLKTINDASPPAAYETTMTLAALAKKFPASFNDLAPFTISRIAIMVQVLKNSGLTADEIEQQVAQLTQAVQESGDGNHVAEVADKVSYDHEGFLRVTIGDDRTPALTYPQGGHRLTASFLASILPGFSVGEVTALKVTVHKVWYELPSYHVYQGGQYVAFALPTEQVQPGDAVGLSFELLPVEDFAASVPDMVLSNTGHLQWLADTAVLKNFKVTDGMISFEVLQNNQWSSVGSYTIEGQVVNYPGVSQQGGIYAEFVIKDFAGMTTNLRLRYDGFSFGGGQLQVVQGTETRPISMVSYDGLRLKLLYSSGNNVATIYLEPPSGSIYSLSDIHPYAGPYLDLVEGKYTNAWQIDQVVMTRNLERAMLDNGGTTEQGRLGAEIAYVVADEDLGLKGIVLPDPVQGGRRLYPQDNSVAIQARFLKSLGWYQDATIQNQLLKLATKLQQDYANQPSMRDGYAILSYVDMDGMVKTIILEVPRW